MYMKLTERNDKFKIKSQSIPNFASRKYVHWRKTAIGKKRVKIEPCYLMESYAVKNKWCSFVTKFRWIGTEYSLI